MVTFDGPRLCCDHHGGWADAPSCEDTAPPLGPCGQCGHLHPDPGDWCPELVPYGLHDGVVEDEAPCPCPAWQPEDPAPCPACHRTPFPGEDHARPVKAGPGDDDVEVVCLDHDDRPIVAITDPWAALAGPAEPPPF